MKTILLFLAPLLLFGQADLLSSARPVGTKGGYSQKAVNLGAGATLDLLPTVTGSGYVDWLWMANGSWDLEVKVYADGETTPSIDVALPYLLGVSYQSLSCCNVPFISKWIGANSGGGGQGGGYLKLPIPFTSSLHITVTNTNTSAAYTIWSEVYYQTGVTISTIPYTQKLHVLMSRAVGVAPNGTATLVNVSPGKRGKLAGFSWLYDSTYGAVSPNSAPLEGEFSLSLDGGTAIKSSGTEDFFGMGGYFYMFNAPTIQDDIGLLVKSSGVWSAFRFFTTDPVVFNNSLNLTWACGMTSVVNFTGQCAMISTVYYYTEL